MEVGQKKLETVDMYCVQETMYICEKCVRMINRNTARSESFWIENDRLKGNSYFLGRKMGRDSC